MTPSDATLLSWASPFRRFEVPPLWLVLDQHIPNIRRAQLLPQFMIELFLPLRDRAELRQIRFHIGV